MRIPIRAALFLALYGASLLHGQLTTEQKLLDFHYMSSGYAKQYAPYEWKRDTIQFDLLDTAAWRTKVAATKTDLEFYDVMSEWVSRLNDAHDQYFLPSTFVARLNFTVDIYDGMILVDSINRTRLPAAEFPFLIGSELISIDGVGAEQILNGLLRYNIGANARSTRRFAASLLTTRPQQLIPDATQVPEISTVVFRSLTGTRSTLRIPWTRSGLPLLGVGRYPGFPGTTSAPTTASMETEYEKPDYMKVLEQLQNCRLPDRAVLGFGARNPIFAQSLPNFTLRQGQSAADPFYSGVMNYGGYRIGYIRIPDFAPVNSAASSLFFLEISYFQANTDCLIVDVMRNPGGSVSYTNQLLSLLIPYRWTAIGFEVRATSNWVLSISQALESARAQGAPQLIIDQLQALKDQIVTANHEMRGRTGPIPLDTLTLEWEPLLDAAGRPIAYSKPLMVLIDETTASGGDAFAATIQDNQRGPLFGWRTVGAGGSVVQNFAGSYSLGSSTVTQSLMSRSREVITPDFPPTRYVENVGVRPDIEVDYMTAGNLVSNGLDYVASFVNAMIQHIQTSSR